MSKAQARKALNELTKTDDELKDAIDAYGAIDPVYKDANKTRNKALKTIKANSAPLLMGRKFLLTEKISNTRRLDPELLLAYIIRNEGEEGAMEVLESLKKDTPSCEYVVTKLTTEG